MIRYPSTLTASALLTLALLLTACGGAEAPANQADAGTETPAATGTPATTTQAANQDTGSQAPTAGGLAPRSSRGGAVQNAPGAGTPTSGAGLAFDLPEGWNAEPPSNNMRMAQATLPGPGGDGQFAAFFFGPGGGGGTEANLQRWAAQVDSGGTAPSREVMETNDLKVHWIETQGTLLASGMPGMGAASDQPGAALYGAVVEGPGGPWFFKVTGPQSTLEQHRDAFRKMLEGLRLQQSV
ncbi:MAG: hypothetical protein SX243_22785 [Acidobacteriota bacterium]|nr:hypothetical protein [Acidobacteriota bacterium]